jgi:hypothetical protein
LEGPRLTGDGHGVWQWLNPAPRATPHPNATRKRVPGPSERGEGLETSGGVEGRGQPNAWNKDRSGRVGSGRVVPDWRTRASPR